MVTRKNINKKYALISVFDKSKLKYLCLNLNKHNYKFISTGSTSKKIRSLGFSCIEVSKITNMKEILDGRVKTLNSKLYGSILYKRDNKEHIEEFKKLKVPKIDLVIINLYPFEKISKKNSEDKIVEMIDIGGPSLLRAAAKNYKFITAISSIKNYEKLILNLKKNRGITDINFRKKMASEVFKKTSTYDDIINQWLIKYKKNNQNKSLRYGENPNQKSYIKEENGISIFDYQINGKDLSYNNIMDIDSGFKCLKEFKEPTCIIIKHNNPCGVASSSNIELAFKKCYESDSKSAFGGIVLLNRKVSSKLADLIKENFFEIIAAPNFYKSAYSILSKKKRMILLKLDKINLKNEEFRSTLFGTLYQKNDLDIIDKNFFKRMTNSKFSKKLFSDLIFATKVVKHVKSNAIVLCSNKQTVGIGMGKNNRIDSLKDAFKSYKNNFKNKYFVCVSDGFFPFTDSLKLLAKNNCKSLAQPAGSINDSEIIKFAKNNNLSLYFLKNRLFKH